MSWFDCGRFGSFEFVRNYEFEQKVLGAGVCDIPRLREKGIWGTRHNRSMGSPMTIEEVRGLVRIQSAKHLDIVNHHSITLKDALVAPRLISVIARDVRNGRVKDENLTAWLVEQERRDDGYKIILREDGTHFGLASKGFPHDKAPILVGWYGDLLTTFLGM